MRALLVAVLFALVALSLGQEEAVQASTPQAAHSHEEFTALESKLTRIQEAANQKLSESQQSFQSQLERLSHSHASLTESVNQLSSSNSLQAQIEASQKRIAEYGDRLASLADSVSSQAAVSKKLSSDIESAVASVASLSSIVDSRRSEAAASSATASAESEKRVSKLEGDIASLKQLVEQLNKASEQLSADIKTVSTKVDTQHESILQRVQELSSSSNITELAKFVDRVSKATCAFYHEHVQPTAVKVWDFTKVYTEKAAQFTYEHSLIAKDIISEHAAAAKEKGCAHFDQGHALLKSKLGENGIPAEHVDKAAFGVIGFVGLILLSIVLLLTRCVCRRCCCGGSRRKEAENASRPRKSPATKKSA